METSSNRPFRQGRTYTLNTAIFSIGLNITCHHDRLFESTFVRFCIVHWTAEHCTISSCSNKQSATRSCIHYLINSTNLPFLTLVPPWAYFSRLLRNPSRVKVEASGATPKAESEVHNIFTSHPGYVTRFGHAARSHQGDHPAGFQKVSVPFFLGIVSWIWSSPHIDLTEKYVAWSSNLIFFHELRVWEMLYHCWHGVQLLWIIRSWEFLSFAIGVFKWIFPVWIPFECGLENIRMHL